LEKVGGRYVAGFSLSGGRFKFGSDVSRTEA